MAQSGLCPKADISAIRLLQESMEFFELAAFVVRSPQLLLIRQPRLHLACGAQSLLAMVHLAIAGVMSRARKVICFLHLPLPVADAVSSSGRCSKLRLERRLCWRARRL